MGVIIPFIIVDDENNLINILGLRKNKKVQEEIEKINNSNITLEEKIELVKQLINTSPPH